MKYTNLGTSNIEISKIGIGTLFQKKIVSISKFRKIILNSNDLGVNFIDTAAIYRSGDVEKFIGKTLGKNRKKFIIATKNLPSKNKFKEIIDSANNSLKKLGTDYIDLYQIHWPNHKIQIEETVEALKSLIKAGKIRTVGLCNSNIYECNKYKKLLKNHLVSIQNEYNLFERGYENNFHNFVTKNKITFIAYSPFLNGKLFNGPRERKILNILEKKYNKSKSEIILNYLTNQSKNIVAIPATLKIKNLIKNINSQNFNISNFDKNLIKNKCKTKIKYIKIENIYVKKTKNNFFWNIDQAKKNEINLDPSPSELAQEIKKRDILKPIKLIKNKNNKKYLLFDGNLRYWAWIIANNGIKQIPSLVWENK